MNEAGEFSRSRAGTSQVERIVREFWRLMASNNFDSVRSLLTDDFVLEWPLSRERICGPDRFIQMNKEYPAHGPWRFDLHRVVAGHNEAVSDTGITDGVQVARAISFFHVRGARIDRMTEFWPEPYEALANRAHLVEPMT